MAERKSSVLDRKYLTGQEAFSFYKDNSKHRKIENTPNLAAYRKIVVSFYDKIAENMIESKGGVFIGGFGYFVVLLNPIRKVQRPTYNKETFYLNAHSNSRVYHPTFIPMTTNYDLQFFVMDRAFTRGVRRRISEKLKLGHKYRNHFGLMMSLFRKAKKYD